MDYIEQFLRDAPYAEHMGVDPDARDVWIETLTDPLTDFTVTVAYTSPDGGRSAESWCIAPDLKDHDMDPHAIHVHKTGEICTDVPGTIRTLPEKRARTTLWLSGFANVIANGRFALNNED